MLFEVKELDYLKTKKNVMAIINQYEKSLTRIETKRHPRITANYTMDAPASSNTFSSKTEDAGLYRIEGVEKDNQFVIKVANVVGNMRLDYQQIIVMCYFMNWSHTKVADTLCLSTANLSIKKRSALELFAYGMGIEVYAEI